MEELTIDPRFRDILPNLTVEEYKTLRANCRADGKINEPIILWGDTQIIVDGHNRYKIAKECGLPFEIERRHFDSFDDAIAWAINNQFGRRNLSGAKASLLRARKVEGKRLEDVASVVGVSARQLRTDRKVAEALEVVPEPLREKVQEQCTQADLLTLAKLGEEEKQQVIAKLGEQTLAQALPKPEKPRHGLDEEHLQLVQQYFDGEARQKILAGLAITPSQVRQIAAYQPMRRQLVMDLVATGCSFVEAIEASKKPVKSPGETSMELNRAAERVEELAAKLLVAMDNYAELRGIASLGAYSFVRGPVEKLSTALAKVQPGQPEETSVARAKTVKTVGALLRCVDDLHRDMPNAAKHNKLLTKAKDFMEEAQEWKSSP